MKTKAKYTSNRKYRDLDFDEKLEKKPQVKIKKPKKQKRNIFRKIWDAIKKFVNK